MPEVSVTLMRSGPDCVRIKAAEIASAWAGWLGAIPWEFFVTLTFDPTKVFPTSAVMAGKEAYWWCGQVGRLHRRPTAWVYSVERGKSGLWHSHALLVGLGGALGTAAPAMWTQRNGRIHVRAVDSATRAVLYTSKEAAFAGEIVLSDTIYRYRGSPSSRVDLFPTTEQR
jgi:hypothetical protein